eukprot:10708707-Lingulodinium_polyedra.AAC.1
MDCAAAVVNMVPGQWIVAGDFNMDPEEMKRGGLLDRLPGVVIATEGGTCRHVAGESRLDYFIASPTMA